MPDRIPAALKPVKADGGLDMERARAILKDAGIGEEGEPGRLATLRTAELIAYQNEAYARRYAGLLGQVVAAESAVRGKAGRVSEGVARCLYQLMAYKDEYEVARLHLLPEERARIEAEFGAGARVNYRLQPPLLQALGVKGKISVGRWFDSVFRLLRAMRGLRGTLFDPFGYFHLRKVERSLVDEYSTAVTQAIRHLDTAYDRVALLVELPQSVRGYESVKLANIGPYRARLVEALSRLDSQPSQQDKSDAGVVVA
jgi:indolepyruvate ferredoxin oxidoreductase